MPRITLDKVKEMKTNGELLLEKEMEEQLSKRVEESTTRKSISKVETSTDITSILNQYKNKEDLNSYEDLAKRVEDLKASLNSIIDNVNDEKISDLSKNLQKHLILSLSTVIDLGLDLTKKKQDLSKIHKIFGNL